MISTIKTLNTNSIKTGLQLGSTRFGVFSNSEFTRNRLQIGILSNNAFARTFTSKGKNRKLSWLDKPVYRKVYIGPSPRVAYKKKLYMSNISNQPLNKGKAVLFKHRCLNALNQTLTLRNFITILASLGVGWVIKTLIISSFGLNISEFIEFISAMLPSAVGAKIFRSIFEAYKPGCIAHASMPIDGMLNPAPGSSGQRDNQLPNNQPPLNQPPLNQPPVQRGSMQDIQARQRAYEDRLERERVIERVRLSAVARQSLVDFSNGTSVNDVIVADPTHIGPRGFLPWGPNQPYATNIAHELVNQSVVGAQTLPFLDSNSRKFLAAVLPEFRPDVYGPNATLTRSSSLISKGDITKLINLT